jgi:hypothetical protein
MLRFLQQCNHRLMQKCSHLRNHPLLQGWIWNHRLLLHFSHQLSEAALGLSRYRIVKQTTARTDTKHCLMRFALWKSCRS